MTVEAIIIVLIIGAVAGWLAGLIVRGMGFGLLGNIVVGIVGALHRRLAVADARHCRSAAATLGAIINATIGAVILLVILGLIRRA